MKWSVIGYSWCPHFQHAKKRFSNENIIINEICLHCEEPNRKKMRQKVIEIIGPRRVIGHSEATSPQIICVFDTVAMCIPGDSELTAIRDLDAYLFANISKFRTFVSKTS